MKYLIMCMFFGCFVQLAIAQDFIVQNNDNVIRGTIRATNGLSVIIANENNQITMIEAKDAKNFFWNGNSYVSKGFAGRKNLDFKFVKVLEVGKVNFYSLGGDVAPPEKQEKRVRFRPSVGIGTGGAGFGGGIIIGGGRNNQSENTIGAPAMRYFIEKPGSGPMQEIAVKPVSDSKDFISTKTVLIQKLGDNAAIKVKLENASELNTREVQSLIESYNKQAGK